RFAHLAGPNGREALPPTAHPWPPIIHAHAILGPERSHLARQPEDGWWHPSAHRKHVLFTVPWHNSGRRHPAPHVRAVTLSMAARNDRASAYRPALRTHIADANPAHFHSVSLCSSPLPQALQLRQVQLAAETDLSLFPGGRSAC